jgi:hypothetical protein
VLGLILALLLAAPAAALCDGVTDDTAAIQAAIHANTPLPAGDCVVSGTLSVANGERLAGQPGVMRTRLRPTAALVSGIVVLAHADATIVGRPSLADFTIMPLPDGAAGYAGILVLGDNGPVDLFLIENVRVENLSRYTHAFLCGRVASSHMRFSQFWNYAGFALSFTPECSNWTLDAVEAHGLDPTGQSSAILLYGSGQNTYLGGNVGYRTAPVWGSGLTFYGTTVYPE